MRKLTIAGPDRHDPDALPVVALVHNEANILPEFLAHYRSICAPSFLIVDDRSDDGSAAILAGAPDVTVLRPVDGSHYRDDKAQWRSDVLDRYCDGRWCLAPDIDEHFVYPGMEERPLSEYLAALEAEGAEAVTTLMVDMYADLPLRDHVFDGVGRLSEAFPFFDGQAAVPNGYYMRRLSRKAARHWPTPPVALSGGLRHRLFYDNLHDLPPRTVRMIERFNRLDRSVNPGPLERLGNAFARRMTWRAVRGNFNATKLGLIRWQAGMRFNGGAHKVDRRLRTSESIAAFRHFVFTRGAAGLAYNVSRGQHNEGARGYRRMLEDDAVMGRSPVWEGTRRYDDSASLAGLIRDVPRAL